MSVALPEVHRVELIEQPLADRTTPPPTVSPDSSARNDSERPPGPASDGSQAVPVAPRTPPETVQLRITRLVDGQSEDVTVRIGEQVGTRIATSFTLAETRWSVCLRPVRYLEPAFLADGQVVILPDGGIKRRLRTLEQPVALPAVVLVDPWGRRTELVPEGAFAASGEDSTSTGNPPAIGPGSPRQDR